MGEATRRHCSLTTSRTSSVFSITSLFENRNTTNPFARRQASLCPSYSSFSACCPPSSSMTIFLSKKTKSTIYASIGCCLRNLTPATYLFLKQRQRRRSVSVVVLRNSLANEYRELRGFTIVHPPLDPLPSREGRKSQEPNSDCLNCFMFRFFCSRAFPEGPPDMTRVCRKGQGSADLAVAEYSNFLL